MEVLRPDEIAITPFDVNPPVGLESEFLAVLDGVQPGHVLVDDRTNPSFFLVCTTFTYAVLLGRPSVESIRALGTFRFSDIGYDNYTLRILPDPGISDCILESVPGLANRREELVYFSSCDGEQKTSTGTGACSVEVVPIREAEYDEITNNNDIATLKAFWAGFNEFNRIGFGYCAKHNGEVVAFCATALVSKRFVMPQVNTLPHWRRKGVATEVSSAFVSHARRRGYVCNWSTQPENAASMSLAQRLGFSGLKRLTCFNLFQPPTVTPFPAELSQAVTGAYRINSWLTAYVETDGKSVYIHDGNPNSKFELFSRGVNDYCCMGLAQVRQLR